MNQTKPKKDWTMTDYSLTRPEIYNFVTNYVVPAMNANRKFICIHAPVKSGKKDIIECIKLHNQPISSRSQSKVKHIFLSSYHRKADDDQRDELKDCGFDVYSIYSKTVQKNCLKNLKKYSKNKKLSHIYVHLDECDYGTEVKSLLSPIYNLAKNVNKFTKLFRNNFI